MPEHERRVAVAPDRERAGGACGQFGTLPPGHVARTDREVGAVVRPRRAGGEAAGIVREVGVDLDHDVVAARDADRVAGAVRAAEPHLARAGAAPRCRRARRRALRPCRRCRRGCRRRRRGCARRDGVADAAHERSMFSTSSSVGTVTQTLVCRSRLRHARLTSRFARGPPGDREEHRRVGRRSCSVMKKCDCVEPGADAGAVAAEHAVDEREHALVRPHVRARAGCAGAGRATSSFRRRSPLARRAAKSACSTSSPSRPKHVDVVEEQREQRHEVLGLEQVHVERVLEVGRRVGRDHERGAVGAQRRARARRRAAPGSRSAR